MREGGGKREKRTTWRPTRPRPGQPSDDGRAFAFHRARKTKETRYKREELCGERRQS